MKINEHESILIRLINEQFEVLNYYEGNFRDIYDHYMKKTMTSLKDPYNPKYPFLTCIDEYDNTFFNWVQIPKLVQELEKLANEDTDNEFKKAVQNVSEYLNKIQSLQYIQFMGD